MELEFKINLDDLTPYEESIAAAIKDELIAQVRAEVRKQSKELREKLAKKIKDNQEQLIENALKAIS